MRFPIVIHKDACSGYGVTVPDLPGCFSAGDSLDEAIESAREAIACHIEGLLMDAEPIPARTSLETHQGNEDYRDGVWAIVAVDVSRLSSKTRRINITLPARVLDIVDQAAVREGQSALRVPGTGGAQLHPAAVRRMRVNATASAPAGGCTPRPPSVRDTTPRTVTRARSRAARHRPGSARWFAPLMDPPGPASRRAPSARGPRGSVLRG